MTAHASTTSVWIFNLKSTLYTEEEEEEDVKCIRGGNVQKVRETLNEYTDLDKFDSLSHDTCWY